jgi:uncharacterized protein YbjT (DUF2867 family)
MSASVFLLGPGFIGGEIIDLLLISKYKVTTLVRRESAVADYANLGVETVVGLMPSIIAWTDGRWSAVAVWKTMSLTAT